MVELPTAELAHGRAGPPGPTYWAHLPLCARKSLILRALASTPRTYLRRVGHRLAAALTRRRWEASGDAPQAALAEGRTARRSGPGRASAREQRTLCWAVAWSTHSLACPPQVSII